MPPISPRGQFAAFAVFVLFAVPALVTMTSCKDEPAIVVKTEVRSEAAAQAAAGSGGIDISIDTDAASSAGIDLSKDLPTFAPVYPGAVVKTQMGKPGADGLTGRLVVMETSDPIAKVSAFYDAQAKAAGINPSMFVNEKDSAVRIFGGADGRDKAGGALIAITKSEEGSGSEIVITSGLAEPEVDRIEGDKEGWRKAVRPDIRLQ